MNREILFLSKSLFQSSPSVCPSLLTQICSSHVSISSCYEFQICCQFGMEQDEAELHKLISKLHVRPAPNMLCVFDITYWQNLINFDTNFAFLELHCISGEQRMNISKNLQQSNNIFQAKASLMFALLKSFSWLERDLLA